MTSNVCSRSWVRRSRRRGCRRGGRQGKGACRSCTSESEGDRRPQAQNRGIPGALSRRIGIGKAAAGIDEILKIGLQVPPACQLGLVADLDVMLGRTDRKIGAGELCGIGVERDGPVADPRDAVSDTENVGIAPGKGALRLSPALAARLTRFISGGAPITRRKAPRARGPLGSGRHTVWSTIMYIPKLP